jgi:hypothetical protein
MARKNFGKIKIFNNEKTSVSNNIISNSSIDFTLDGNMNANYPDSYVRFPTTNNIFIGDTTTTLDNFISSNIPIGTIVMWYKGAIPSGWAQCNGLNGTPDIRNRMVIGRNTTYVTTGGSSTVKLLDTNIPAHAHAMTSVSTAGTHNHQVYHRNDTGESSSTTAMLSRADTKRSEDPSYGTRSEDWEHTHSYTTPLDCGVEENTQTPINILPRHFPLIYIMKIA